MMYSYTSPAMRFSGLQGKMTNCIPSRGTRMRVALTAFMYMLDSARCVSLSLVTNTRMMFRRKKRFTWSQKSNPTLRMSTSCQPGALTAEGFASFFNLLLHSQEEPPLWGRAPRTAGVFPRSSSSYGGNRKRLRQPPREHTHTHTHTHTHSSAARKKAFTCVRLHRQMFLDRYSLVVKVLFPGHSVDGSRNQRKTWERETVWAEKSGKEAGVCVCVWGGGFFPDEYLFQH